MVTVRRTTRVLLVVLTMVVVVAEPYMLVGIGWGKARGGGSIAEAQNGGAAVGKCPVCGAAVVPRPGQLLCPQCGVPLVSPGQTGTGPVMVCKGLRLKPFVYTDTEGTGLPVMAMLIPVGWEFRGGLKWNLNDPAAPAAMGFVVANPEGQEAFECFPTINFYWSNDPLSLQLNPIGSRSLAGEVRPPMGAQQMLREIVLPRYRGRAPNAKIVREEHLPDLPAKLGASIPRLGGTADGARVRITYSGQGGPIEEEIYGVVEVLSLSGGSIFGTVQQVIWLADFLFSARAPAGRLDAAADLFRVVGSSIRANPDFLAAHDAIKTALCQGQIRHTRQIGEIGRRYAREASAMRDASLKDWYGRQAVYDNIMDNVSRTIRGVDAYYDPYKQQVVELPGGYGHAWTNNLGEYIVTESPSFNPNIGSNLHWEPMPGQ